MRYRFGTLLCGLLLLVLRSGGQAEEGEVLTPQPGKPPLNRPLAVPASRADFLMPYHLVMGVGSGHEYRAYPVSMLVFHKVCNDVLGGHAICVTF